MCHYSQWFQQLSTMGVHSSSKICSNNYTKNLCPKLFFAFLKAMARFSHDDSWHSWDMVLNGIESPNHKCISRSHELHCNHLRTWAQQITLNSLQQGKWCCWQLISRNTFWEQIWSIKLIQRLRKWRCYITCGTHLLSPKQANFRPQYNIAMDYCHHFGIKLVLTKSQAIHQTQEDS